MLEPNGELGLDSTGYYLILLLLKITVDRDVVNGVPLGALSPYGWKVERSSCAK